MSDPPVRNPFETLKLSDGQEQSIRAQSPQPLGASMATSTSGTAAQTGPAQVRFSAVAVQGRENLTKVHKGSESQRSNALALTAQSAVELPAACSSFLQIPPCCGQTRLFHSLVKLYAFQFQHPRSLPAAFALQTLLHPEASSLDAAPWSPCNHPWRHSCFDL